MSDRRKQNEPWSEHFRIAALEWVDKNAAADILEEAKTATLAQRMQPLIASGKSEA